MKKVQKILSLALVLLLVTSITVPAVSAEPVPLVAPVVAVTVPEVADVVIGGVAYTIVGGALVKIGEHLGIKWDEVAENFNNFASSVGKKLSDIISGGKWVDVTSSEADALFDYYTATAGSGGKKDDKLYHKAELKNGKVKINTERISEKDAAKELKEGRDIFTSTKELAENLVNRVSKENHAARKLDGKPKEFSDRDIENHGVGKKGYYDHYHPEYQHTRPHCWWKNP